MRQFYRSGDLLSRRQRFRPFQSRALGGRDENGAVDSAASGVIFTLDAESGFRDVVFVTGVYGLGENIVQGTVDPDEFYVHKPTYHTGHRAVLSRSLGRKQQRMIYAERGGGTKNVPVSEAERERFCLADAEVLKLAGDAITIEDHYSKSAGHPVPMDIEWAKDGDDGQLYIIQARPETVVSQRAPTGFETYALGASGTVLATGQAVGEKIAAGAVRVIADARQLAKFKPGEVLVADSTTPDWEPVMKIAAGIVARARRADLPCGHWRASWAYPGSRRGG